MTRGDIGIVAFYVLTLLAFGAALVIGLIFVAATMDALP